MLGVPSLMMEWEETGFWFEFTEVISLASKEGLEYSWSSSFAEGGLNISEWLAELEELSIPATSTAEESQGSNNKSEDVKPKRVANNLDMAQQVEDDVEQDQEGGNRDRDKDLS
ncbi:hypothetical protein WICPIJ_005374 [Wickerhamomyces pijperi]|uniref:Uncharacterized protein n=1 Tax=Wickerhamomyces pijperi TaxID=599730 RepID=A0A9P8TM27_WICPI|nr:hypothetical protein WICPIJ_005374 [Wickerhamomyces pijperi]